jgi:hypothetical protein
MLLLPLQALVFLTGNPMSPVGGRVARCLDWGLVRGVNLLEFATIFREALLNIIALNGLIRAGVAHRFDLTVHMVRALRTPSFQRFTKYSL